MPEARDDLMTPGAERIDADDSADENFAMLARKVRRLPILDGHHLVGMVALADVLCALPGPRPATSSKTSTN
ncbi:CBS domain-containing protein [Streptomyces sp. NPDC048650]|uniref:CBS domain-containing protein n=1 Tax=unclassified Streptomyces TaxID=2593676 RepID=UPI0037210282